MKCTKILEQEHEVILSYLNKLSLLINGAVFKEIHSQLPEFIEFIKIYSDEFHHAKEEDIYFKWMVQYNPSLEFGPIACMLSEHETFRALIAKASKELNDYQSTQSLQSMQGCKDALNQFISQLSSHIDKENNILYKMADNLDVHIGGLGDQEMYEKFMELEKLYADKIKRFL